MTNKSMKNNPQSGVVLLPMILAMSFIVMVIVLGMATLTFVETNISSAQRNSDEAFAVADAGASDGVLTR